MSFTIKYDFDIETKQYIAEIPEFNLSDYGDSIDEADKNLKQALVLYLEEITNSRNVLNAKKVEYA